VVALEDSECLVLKSPDFRIFAFKHPTVLMQMGRVLAQRLKASNEMRDQNSPR
jgi:CRP-like cAMP-binding protein